MANKERPIIFNAEMVRAILNGRKTQTRRVAKVTSDGCNDGFITPLAGFVPRSIENHISYCPYGVIGDKLWVRETWSKAKQPYLSTHIFYRADGETNGKQFALSFVEREKKWRPSIHMPRSESRILLEITNVRIERLNDISERDAISEGATFKDNGVDRWGTQKPGWSHFGKTDPDECLGSAKHSFGNLWDRINGEGSFYTNPWVWVIGFDWIHNGK